MSYPWQCLLFIDQALWGSGDQSNGESLDCSACRGSCELLVIEVVEDGFLPINASPIERSAAPPVVPEVRHVISMGGQ
ncbi:hypothetical protein BU25DRAFT_405343 [Macroventuria anomochaeta]|uniref:Uncharacterized protein n=1 Tax=Macroventuria anomochaeta TaxID=301207 RepID=A0ACB6SHK0_9PLEO|nr:uncharacterized protein BU25DRAFT_405343 [Macroventuria anomochaeta]KAF2633448.1 hypothetical protein BU25DRAFT_405343 [Macroventuria anomochaeta]